MTQFSVPLLIRFCDPGAAISAGRPSPGVAREKGANVWGEI